MFKAAEIHERGGKFVVTTEGGDKVLGTHDTKAEAEKQLQAIHINQHKKSYVVVGSPSCATCDEPSTNNHPVHAYRTETGTVVFRHSDCAAKDSPKLSSKSPTLACDNPHCDYSVEVGDENETDLNHAPGEVCIQCNRGSLSYRTGTINERGYTFENPAKARTLQRAQEVAANQPSQPKPTAPIVRKQVDNLDENNDGESPGSGPM